MSTLTTPLNGSGIGDPIHRSANVQAADESSPNRPTRHRCRSRSRARALLLRWRRGNLDFVESRIRGLVSLSLAAELGKPLRHSAGFGNGSQDSNCCLAAFEVLADALAVAGLEAEVLVVERAQRRATDNRTGAYRCDRGENQSDPRALAQAALADLLGLDFTLVIQDQDADGVTLRDLAVTQRARRSVGRCLVVEGRQNDRLVSHACDKNR